jgi:large subunit ribosomal protein L35
MKQKSHSGYKKRVKIRASGTVSVEKSCKKHLLANKSKRQKKSFKSGMPVHKTKMRALRRLMPGRVGLRLKKNI